MSTPTSAAWALSPKDTCIRIGCKMTFLYQEIAAGRIEARKIGAKTMIPTASITQYIERLPLAVIRSGRNAVANNN